MVNQLNMASKVPTAEGCKQTIQNNIHTQNAQSSRIALNHLVHCSHTKCITESTTAILQH